MKKVSDKQPNFKFAMGVKLRDPVSGFEGVVCARSEYATGCNHYGLKPSGLTEKGTLKDWAWIDENYLEELPTAEKQKRGNGGGPAPDPPAM